MYIIGGAHGRHRLGRSRQRRWIRHSSGDGNRPRFQQPRRAVTERSVRFALWNNEETGTEWRPRICRSAEGSSRARRIPAGSGKYPEPKWLGMIQHDMMMFDHGMPHQGWHSQRTSAPRSRRQYRVSDDLEIRGAGAGAGVGNSRPPTKNTPPIIRPRWALT